MAAESLDWRQDGDIELSEFMPVYGDLNRQDMIPINFIKSGVYYL